MISYRTYCEFITTYHPDYNGKCLHPIEWCHDPKMINDYVYFIKRDRRSDLNCKFFAKYDDEKNIINIRFEYYYYGMYEEENVTYFELHDYNKNTYNHKTHDGSPINFIADEEVQTFIKQFNNFMLEQKDELFTEEEYNKFMRYFKKNHPELMEPLKSDICDFDIKFSFDFESLKVSFSYIDKADNSIGLFEFNFYKNRMIGDDYYDMRNLVHEEITSRMTNINIEFYTFINLFLPIC
jgi:hypothetical protein